MSAQPSTARALPWSTASIQWLPAALARRLFGQPLAPTAEEWQRVQAGLQRGDPAMDRLVNWMFAVGPRQGQALFEQVLNHGLDTLPDAPEPLRTFFAEVEAAPAWLDRELLERGVLASHLSGRVSFYVLRDMALMGGYVYFNSMNQTLAAAGPLTSGTTQRLGETGKWLVDVTEPGGMERFGKGFATTLRVRLVHALVRRHLQSRPEWDAMQWGLPINQVDMLSTYLAFGPVTLSGSRLFGLWYNRQDSAAFVHLWRYIGWLMGVDEDWLAGSEGDGLRRLYHTFLTHRLPDDKIRQLGSALRDEPLTQPLPAGKQTSLLARGMRRLRYHQHLSNSALILGPLQRRRLGLPMLTLPWYPLLSAPFRLARLTWMRLRGGHALETYRQQCRQQQIAQLDAYFNGKPQDIIRPEAGHPAHVA